MKKMTLLELAQKVLRSIGGDEVNDISDNVEVSDVVEIIEDTYFDIITRIDAPERYDMCKLDPFNDPVRPTILKVPNLVDTVLWVKYNTKRTGETEDNWTDMVWMEPKEFVDYVQTFTQADGNTFWYRTPSTDFSGVKLYYDVDRPPKYYTSFDDQNLIFDAFDQDVEATLTNNNSAAYVIRKPYFEHTNDYIPQMDANLFPLLLAEAKATAWAELKQSQNARAEKSSKKHWIHQQKSKQNIKGNSLFDNRPNYGRK